MQGVVFTGNRNVEVRTFPDPEPGPGEVVVRVRASGMCGTDLHVYRGPTPDDLESLVIQGHEPCGEIAAVGAGVDERMACVGQRVMIHHYWGCGTCGECRSGWPQLCSRMEPRIASANEHGGHAEFMRVPAIQTMPLPDPLSFKAGAALGCGTGTAWGTIVRLGDIAGRDLVVMGQGPVGASATLFASALGARVIAVDIAAPRLDRASRLGAHAVINAASVDVAQAVRELTGGRGAELAMETSGNAAAVRHAIDGLATWGKLCLIGVGADVAFNTRDTLTKQLTVLTSWTLSTPELIRCASFAVDKKLPIDDLFSHGWSLQEAAEAYQWFDQQRDGKGVFEF